MNDKLIGLAFIFGIAFGGVATCFWFIEVVPNYINQETQEQIELDLPAETGGLHIEKEELYKQSFDFDWNEIKTKFQTIFTVYDGEDKLVVKRITEFGNQESIAYFCLDFDSETKNCVLPLAVESGIDPDMNITLDVYEIIYPDKIYMS